MLFIFFLLLSHLFIHIHSKLITYTLYQTNEICQYNWKGSICLPIFSLNKTNQPLSIQLDRTYQNYCPSQILVYIRTRQCIYCAKNRQDIHCNHYRLRRMTPTQKEDIHRNEFAIIGIGLLGILIIGSLLTLLFIKRSPAHTNLLELFNPQPNSNIQSINHIKIPRNIKVAQIPSSQPIPLTIPKRIQTTK